MCCTWYPFSEFASAAGLVLPWPCRIAACALHGCCIPPFMLAAHMHFPAHVHTAQPQAKSSKGAKHSAAEAAADAAVAADGKLVSPGGVVGSAQGDAGVADDAAPAAAAAEAPKPLSLVRKLAIAITAHPDFELVRNSVWGRGFRCA